MRYKGQKFSIEPGNIGTLVNNVDDGAELPRTFEVKVAQDGRGVLTGIDDTIAQAVMNARLRGKELVSVEIVEVTPCPHRVYREKRNAELAAKGKGLPVAEFWAGFSSH